MLTERQPWAVGHNRNLKTYFTDKQFDQLILEGKKDNKFIYAHTSDALCGDCLVRFALAKPEYVPFLQIRDLRDVLVSYVYFVKLSLEIEMGGVFSFDEMLTHLLQNNGSKYGTYIENQVKLAIDWLDVPHVVVLRFEDMIGAAGGGSVEAQAKTISSMAAVLGVPLSEEKLKNITDKLFGNSFASKDVPFSRTFREGKIGAWKKHFKPHHLKLFNAKWKKYQQALGYSEGACAL